MCCVSVARVSANASIPPPPWDERTKRVAAVDTHTDLSAEFRNKIDTKLPFGAMGVERPISESKQTRKRVPSLACGSFAEGLRNFDMQTPYDSARRLVNPGGAAHHRLEILIKLRSGLARFVHH